MFFSNISISPLGLDISDLSLKIVQLKKGRNSYKLEALSKAKVPRGILSQGEIKDIGKLSAILKKLVDEPSFGKIKTRNVVACLPETKTFVKLIKISKSSNQIEDLIETEISKYIPLSLKDMYYDWQIIKEDNDKILVLVGAAPQSIVNQYIDLLDRADLLIEALEIEPLAICRSLLIEESCDRERKEGRNVVILDIGATRSSLIFYSQNTILFTSSLEISVKDFKEDKNKNIKIVVKKIRDFLNFYHENFSNRGEIETVYLCGGGASINLSASMSELLSIKVEVGNPLVNLFDKRSHINNIFSTNKYFPPSFATAVGLSLFRPQHKK